MTKSKISIEELNKCYIEVNSKYKSNGYPTREEVKWNLIRDPDYLKYFPDLEPVLTLKFKQEAIGVKGSYIFISQNIYVDTLENP